MLYAVPVKNKIHPLLIKVHSESISEEKFICESLTSPIWFYSEEEEFEEEIDISGVRNWTLYLKEIDELKKGFYFCYGTDVLTKEAFICSAELIVYGN